jgi:sugar lactone lactonase YvrE
MRLVALSAATAWLALSASGLFAQGTTPEVNYLIPFDLTTYTGSAGQPGSNDGSLGTAEFSVPTGVTVDLNGNVYVADTGNDTIRVISSAGTVTTLAGSPGNAGSADGSASSARFLSPSGVAVDSAGNVYVADTGNNTIRVITSAGTVTTLAGSVGFTGSADGAGSSARFSSPSGIAVDAAGNIYVSDRGNNTIRMVTSAGVVTTLAGLAGTPGFADGTGRSARFSSPSGIAVDGAGTIYVADTGNDTIRTITNSGVVTTLAGTAGSPGYGDGVPGEAHFSSPQGVAVDKMGNVYISDTGNDTIRVLTYQTEPWVSTLSGVPGRGGSADGWGNASLLLSPTALAADSQGDVYVADSGNDTIRAGGFYEGAVQVSIQPTSQTVLVGAFVEIQAHSTGYPSCQWQLNGIAIPGATQPLLTINYATAADAGTYTVVVTNMAGSSATSNASTLKVNAPIGFATGNLVVNISGGPNGVAVDGSDDVYFAAGNAIEAVDPFGGAIVFAGSQAASGSTDGIGAAARFNSPTGMAADAAGNLYVADSGNNIIRKISANGAVTTLAGSNSGPGNADGEGPAAQFNNPVSVASDNLGNVYVADVGNNELRKVAPNGTTTTLLQSSFFATANASADGPFFISSVAVDGKGNLYVGATNHGAGTGNTGPFMIVLQVTGVGIATQVTGFGGGDWPTFGGVVAADSTGNLYMVFNNTLFLLSPQYSQTVSAIASPSQGLNGPSSISVGPGGLVYTADPHTGTIDLVTPSGSLPPAASPTPPVTPSPPPSAAPAPPASPSLDPTPTPSSTPPSVTPAPSASPSLEPTPTPSPTPIPIQGSSPSAGASVSAAAVSSGAASVNPAGAARLANISSRALVGTNSNVEIAGFVIYGPAGSTKQVLIRGVGPSLAQFGVSGVLARPVLSLFDSSGAAIATNTGWNNSPNLVEIAAATASAGAFSLSNGSGDSALLVDLAPGSYTAQVSGLNSSSGVALAEVYELNDGAPQLLNISTRAFVGTASNVQIAGIVISGSQPASVLVRAVGPTLASFGVNGVLEQPTLSVVDSNGDTLATNTGWATNSNASGITLASTSAGAFALPPGSADCALLMTLPPGSYTAIVSGVGGSSGTALVEAYLVQ